MHINYTYNRVEAGQFRVRERCYIYDSLAAEICPLSGVQKIYKNDTFQKLGLFLC
jgi:hypothetical protein